MQSIVADSPPKFDGETSLAQLNDRLDDLWSNYLNHLDRYTISQQLLQKHMSAGYMALARANFNARDGVRRYGKDYYHEHAVASRRVCMSLDNEHQRLRTDVISIEFPPESDMRQGSATDAPPEETVDPEPTQQASPPHAPPSEPDSHGREKRPAQEVPLSGENGLRDRQENTGRKAALAATPLRWYGVLVPSDLRSAQTSFASAVENAVADAADSTRNMREVESEIRRLRKDIRRAERAAG